MRHLSQCFPRRGAVVLVLMAFSRIAMAEGMIDINPYFSTNVAYDDNLFKVSGKDEARLTLGSEAMSDTTTRLDAGVNVDWKISRQHVRLDMNFNQSRFNRFNFLNNDGYARKLGWDWVVGSHLGGELSISEARTMGGFTEIQNPVLNQRTSQRKVMNAHWDFHPRWRLHVQRDESESENSSNVYRSSNRQDVGHEVMLQYTTPAGNRLGLTAREVKSEYPSRDRFQTLVFGNGNTQRDVALNMVWNATGKTRFTGRVARVDRRYEELSERDIQDWTAQAGVYWQATGKTSVAVNAGRDIYGVDDIAATYVQNDSVSINPTWVATSKLMVQARAAYEKRSYQGDPGFLLGRAPVREDELKSAGLTVTYTPHQKVRMQMAWQKDKRESTQVNNGYDSSTLSANVRIDF